MKVRCPKCDAELDVESADPDVGIMSAGAYCDACDLAVDVDYEPNEDDVQIFGTGKSLPEPISRKCACIVPLEAGYGMVWLVVEG